MGGKTFINPFDGNLIRHPSPTVSSLSRVIREIPAGAINGVNVTFTVAFPLVAGSEILTRNGLEETEGVNYTMVGQTITFTIAPLAAPVQPDVLRISYRKI